MPAAIDTGGGGFSGSSGVSGDDKQAFSGSSFGDFNVGSFGGAKTSASTNSVPVWVVVLVIVVVLFLLIKRG